MILLNPGPANTTQTVKDAMGAPDICPRESEFGAVLRGVRDDVARVVHTGHTDSAYTAVLFGGSGTAAVEAAVASSVPADGRLLVIDNGSYGARMADIAAAYGMQHETLRLGVGGRVVPAEIESTLQGGRFTQLALVHHETSTGMLNPIAEVAQVASRHGVEVIVDAMSSYAGLAIDVEALGIDFLVSSSNKCIQGMAGLGFVICRRARLESMQPVPGRSLYLSLADQHRFFEQSGQMRFTPPVPIVYALAQALKEFFEEGPSERYARYRDNWLALDGGVRGLGFQRLLPDDVSSGILSAYIEPSHPAFSFDGLHDRLYAKGFTIYPGKGADRATFRLANMGAVVPDDMRAFVEALSETLVEMGVPLPVAAP